MENGTRLSSVVVKEAYSLTAWTSQVVLDTNLDSANDTIPPSLHLVPI